MVFEPTISTKIVLLLCLLEHNRSNTMKVSVPASAAIILPDTGASNLTGFSQSPTQCIIIQQQNIKRSN